MKNPESFLACLGIPGHRAVNKEKVIGKNGEGSIRLYLGEKIYKMFDHARTDPSGNKISITDLLLDMYDSAVFLNEYVIVYTDRFEKKNEKRYIVGELTNEGYKFFEGKMLQPFVGSMIFPIKPSEYLEKRITAYQFFTMQRHIPDMMFSIDSCLPICTTRSKKYIFDYIKKKHIVPVEGRDVEASGYGKIRFLCIASGSSQRVIDLDVAYTKEGGDIISIASLIRRGYQVFVNYSHMFVSLDGQTAAKGWMDNRFYLLAIPVLGKNTSQSNSVHYNSLSSKVKRFLNIIIYERDG